MEPAVAELTSGGETPLGAYKLTAVQAGSVGNDIAVTISDSEAGGEEGAFKLTVQQGDTVETYDPVSPKRGRTNVVTVVNATSTLIRLEETSRTAIEAVARGSVTLAGGGEQAPTSLDAGDYVGDSASRSGVGGLEAVDEVTMLCVPDLIERLPEGPHRPRGREGRAARHDLPLRADGRPDGDHRPAPRAERPGHQEWRVDDRRLRLEVCGALLAVGEGVRPGVGDERLPPPSGHVAGIWSRNDNTRGVHKAPANEVIRGAIDLELNITKTEHDLLNPVGINAIRSFPGRGSASGAPARSPRIRRGATSTSVASSTTSRSRSSADRLGGLRAERPGAVGEDPPDDRGVPRERVAQGALFGSQPRRRPST